MSAKFLKNIPREAPFKVPEGYFGELHTRIMARTSQKRITHVSVPRRPASPEDFTLKTPPGYFESLPARISNRVARDAAAPATRFRENPSIYRRAEGYKIAAAACVTLLLGVLGILQVARKHDTREPATSVMNFDQEILIQEYLEVSDREAENKPGELEIYLLNQVEEGMLLQEL